MQVLQIVLWYLDSGCFKHMTGQRSQLIKFIEKFLSTVRFCNDHIAKIMGYGDYQMGNVMISRVYYVEGLGHNLFFVGQFCDSDLEVAFRKHTCYIRDLEGVDLLKGSWGSNLYTLSLENMMISSPICLLSKASKTKSPKLKFKKDHLCSACSLGKSKKHSHKPKSEDTNQEKLSLLHMDLCGPMRVESINGKKYILVIVDDYSRFTWVKLLRSKDEAPEFIIKFLKMIQVLLNTTVRNIRTHNGTEFENQTLRSYYEDVGISHETSVARTPQRNGVFERRNWISRAKPSFSNFFVLPTRNDWDNLFQPLFDEYFNPPSSVVSLVPAVVTPEPTDPTGTPSSTSIDQDAPSLSTSQTPQESQSQVIPPGVEEEFHDIEVVQLDNDPFFGLLIPYLSSEESSSRDNILTNVHSVNQPLEHISKWTKDHSIDNVIGDPSKLVYTRHQLQTEALFC
ncbi:retrovirus-related pol polyprotein from transposon TNT 1-94 [Tanacetum coccineum]